MKKNILFSLIAIALLIGCKDEDIVDNANQVGISRITYYPVLTLKGELFMSIAQNSTFTEPGATAVAGTAQVNVTTSGTVDTSTPGVYTITYKAVNADGFSVTNSRVVGVYDATVIANDFSGNYARSTNQSRAEWTKVAPGMYTVFNPGGAPGTNLTIHAFNTTGYIITVPSQVSSDGSITSCTNESGGANITYNPGPPAKYSWKVVNPGYGTALRTFNKL